MPVWDPGSVGTEDALPEGIYESLISRRLAGRLASVPQNQIQRTKLDPVDAPDRIALHLAKQIERFLGEFEGDERLRQAQVLVESVLGGLGSRNQDSFNGEVLEDPVALLSQVMRRRFDGSFGTFDQPLVPLLDSTLLTNSRGEPGVGQAIKSEIDSSASIDVIMAFITVSGILPVEELLRQHCQGGRRLRIITTTFSNITQRAVLDRLAGLGAEIRISYDESSTRLHAKAWMFHRAEGHSTAFIGSSNLTHQALVTGLEWNVRLSGIRNPHVIEKMRAVFETYWESPDFISYDPEDFSRRAVRNGTSSLVLGPVSIRPLPFQERMLELLQLERERGRHRNLLVSATGTGKTVMAALDYVNLRQELVSKRLLFIAHRKEILEQSRNVFRQAMMDATFGELWVDGQRPVHWEHVFASVQSLSVDRLKEMDPRHFDVLIIDEFHHASAKSYSQVLEHFEPAELLGLTATPERADGADILGYFDNRIAAELRLWDAIEAGYLSPFAYYGISDGTDLRNVGWTRGKGYDIAELDSIYTANDIWASMVLNEFLRHIDNPESVRGLGFCVSVKHAKFMAAFFSRHGLASLSVDGSTQADERRQAIQKLKDGDIRVIFSVDVFNEGVDVPAVDAIMMLRPSDSPVLFMQQLGRGLRKHQSKSICTVLDFVGQHRKEYRFDRRFGALLGESRQGLIRQVEEEFPYLPAGCHVQLDRVVSGIVLENLRNSLPTKWVQRVDEMRRLVDSGKEPSLGAFLEVTGLDIEDIYAGGYSFSDLLEAAGVLTQTPGPSEKELRKAVGRLLHVDDQIRLSRWSELLIREDDVSEWSEVDRRTIRMLTSQLLGQVEALPRDVGLQEGLDFVRQHPRVCEELKELCGVLAERITHVVRSVSGVSEVPLRVHARYTRLEILSAFGHGDGARANTWQTGVMWLPDSKSDVFAFTLDKSKGNFSPNTRYRDYAISRDLIHWESQSVTRADSTTGLRYINHEKLDSEIQLFARLRTNERAFWYLGPATYVSHEGECPMAIKWRLRYPLPADLFSIFAAAVA